MRLFFRKDLIQALIQVFAVEEDDQEHRDRDEWVGDIKHRAKEQALACCVANQWEVQHIHHSAVEPTCIFPNLTIEHAVYDIS